MSEMDERNVMIIQQMADANKNERIDKLMGAVRAALTFGISSAAFKFTVAATILILAMGSWETIAGAFDFKADALLEQGFHFQVLRKAMHSDVFAFALPILSTIPGSAMLLEELKTGFIKEYLPRTSKNGYILGKLAGCMICGGFSVVCGILSALAVSMFVFLPREKSPGEDVSYLASAGELMQNLLLFFCIGAFFALVGMTLSVVTGSRYMAYISPFILYYVLIILCERYIRSCYMLYPREWIAAEKFPGGVYGVILFLGECAAGLAFLFYRLAERKISGL